jgi:hypothetical protein
MNYQNLYPAFMSRYDIGKKWRLLALCCMIQTQSLAVEEVYGSDCRALTELESGRRGGGG